MPFSDGQDLLLELVRGRWSDRGLELEGYTSVEIARARAQIAAEKRGNRLLGQTDGSAVERG